MYVYMYVCTLSCGQDSERSFDRIDLKLYKWLDIHEISLPIDFGENW